MTDSIDWNRLVAVATSTLPGDLVARLASVTDATEPAELWVWDVQRRTVGGLRSGTRGDPSELHRRWPVVRELRVLGEHLGFLTLGEPAEALEDDVIDAIAGVAALALGAGAAAGDTVRRGQRNEEMSLPAELQWSLLPATERRMRSLDLTAAVEPAYDTGGDIFDHALDGDDLFLAVLDARGHGLRAASTASIAAGAMRRARRLGADLVEIAAEIDTAISAVSEDDFVSAVLVRIDLDDWSGSWLTAGHRPPLVLSGDTVRELPIASCLPLGMTIDGDRPAPTTHELRLEPGDALVLYSDGIVENIDTSTDEMIGDAVFQRVISDVRKASRPDAHLARQVVEALLALTGARIRDDATLLIAGRTS